jgi:alpha-aminoadipate carrier protein LysW
LEVEGLKVRCPGCDGELEVPNDALSGEIVSCPDCGQEYEVEVEGGKVELKAAERLKEDWGE